MQRGSVLALWHGVLAAASTAVAGSTLADLIGPRMAGLMGLMIAALQTGTAAYHAANIRYNTKVD